MIPFRMVGAIGIAACVQPFDVAAQEAAGGQPEQASAQIIGADGTEIGKATISAGADGGVLIEMEADGLPANQWLAFHIHENGECENEGGFQSAGGHFNPYGGEHGFYSEGGPHAGDMPNQYVDSDGTLRGHVFNNMVTLDEDDAAVRGRALIIHADADSYDPAHDTGDRIGCGVIE